MRWTWLWFVLALSCSAIYAQEAPVRVEHNGMTYTLENGQWVVSQGQATAKTISVLQNGKYTIYKSIRVASNHALEVLKLGKWSLAIGDSIAVDDIKYKFVNGRWIVDHGVRLEGAEVQVYDSGVWVVKSGSALEKPVVTEPEKEEPVAVVPEKEKPAPVVPEKEKPAPVVPEKEQPVVVVPEKETQVPPENFTINKDGQLETREDGQVVARDGFELAVDGMIYKFEQGKWKVDNGTIVGENITLRNGPSLKTLTKTALRIGRDGVVSFFDKGEWLTQTVTDITIDGMQLLHEADWIVFAGIKLVGGGVIQIIRGGKWVVVEGARIISQGPGYLYQAWDGTTYHTVNAVRAIYGGLVFVFEGGKWYLAWGIQLTSDGLLKLDEKQPEKWITKQGIIDATKRADQKILGAVHFVMDGIVYTYQNREWIAEEGTRILTNAPANIGGVLYKGYRIGADGVLWVYENDEWILSKATEIALGSVKYAYQQGKWKVTGAFRLVQAGGTNVVQALVNNEWVNQKLNVVAGDLSYALDASGRWVAEKAATVVVGGITFIFVNGVWVVQGGISALRTGLGKLKEGYIKFREGGKWLSAERVKFLRDQDPLVMRDGKWEKVKPDEIIDGDRTYERRDGAWLVKKGIEIRDNGTIWVNEQKTWLVQKAYTFFGRDALGKHNSKMSDPENTPSYLRKLWNSFTPREWYHTMVNYLPQSVKNGTKMLYDNVIYLYDGVNWLVTGTHVGPHDLIWGGGKTEVEEMTIAP